MAGEHDIREGCPFWCFLRVVFQQNAKECAGAPARASFRSGPWPRTLSFRSVQPEYGQRHLVDVQHKVFVTQYAEPQIAEAGQPVFQSGIKVLVARAGMDAVRGVQIRQNSTWRMSSRGWAVHKIPGHDDKIWPERVDPIHHIPHPGAGKKVADVQIGKLNDAQAFRAAAGAGRGSLWG